MKKLLLPLLFCLSLTTGCVSGTVKEKLSKNAAQLDGYVTKMDKGETTKEEDQDLIRAMRIWTWSMNQAANGEVPPADVRLILEEGTKD